MMIMNVIQIYLKVNTSKKGKFKFCDDDNDQQKLMKML